ncbi:MAG: ABC transporter permease [Treponema sp.]|jgi:simple sugar transport system permease protein|nr:ABC transporter permease [Treponema sp.]
MFTQICNFIAADIRTAMPIMIAALGLVFSERAGVVNIGAEGILLFGSLAGVVASWYSGSAWIGLVFAMLTGGIIALVFAYLTVSLYANQVVVGAAINILALGTTTSLNRIIFGVNAAPPKIASFANIQLPEFIRGIPFIGGGVSTIFSQNILVYSTFLLIIPIAHFVMFKTELGLNIRGVGEHPKACDTVGINVYKIRYGTIIVSGLFCGAAGAYVSLGLLSFFMEDMIAGRGFIALAAVAFGKYTPLGIMGASLLFGGGLALESRLQALGTGIPYQFFLMIPYILTILALVGFAGKNKGPAAGGTPYLKE